MKFRKRWIINQSINQSIKFRKSWMIGQSINRWNSGWRVFSLIFFDFCFGQMHEVDEELLSTFLTFELLFGICGSDKGNSSRRVWQFAPVAEPAMISSVIAAGSSQRAANPMSFDENAEIHDFPFDFARFIAKCQRTRYVVTSYMHSWTCVRIAWFNQLVCVLVLDWLIVWSFPIDPLFYGSIDWLIDWFPLGISLMNDFF